MGIIVNIARITNRSVQETLSRKLLRLREKHIPRWKAYVKPALEEGLDVKPSKLIHIRNTALLNLKEISRLLKAGGKVDPEKYESLARDLLCVIIITTGLMDRLREEGKITDGDLSSPHQAAPLIIEANATLDPYDPEMSREFGIRVISEEELLPPQ